MKLPNFLHYINIPRHLANHVIGKQHTKYHRYTAGVIVMAIGVTVAHSFSHVGNTLVALMGDLVGYSIHGTGLIPFLHDIEKSAKEQSAKQETKCETC